MATVEATTVVPLSNILTKIQDYKYNPSNIQRVILDHLDEITDGKINVVDPSNPFVFLLEMSAVNASAAMVESIGNLRRQYPVLSQSVDEIYPHMSDKDFVNLFATPSKANFTFMIQKVSLLNNLVDVPLENCKKVTIPRNTAIKFDNYTFSLQYPIDIRLYTNDEIQITYDSTSVSPLQSLTTNVIPKLIKKDKEGNEWLTFTVELQQFSIITTHFALQDATVFQEDILYEDNYYFCRVFYKKDTATAWTEMKTTLTDQVYDPFTPTAVVKPNDETNTLSVFIPPVYMTSGLIDGNLRIDIYETKGTLNLDTSNYLISSFSTALLAIDSENDTNVYTAAMTNVSFLTYTNDFVTGGSNAITFNDLRSGVINNSVGYFEQPITNVQLVATAQKDSFTIVKNVDIVTNRMFLATRDLPAPTNKSLITPANITVDTLVTSMDILRSVDSVKNHGNRLTVLSMTLYNSLNGVLKIVDQASVAAIKLLSQLPLCANVNDNNYVYSPFYYVLDNTSNEFEVRAYHLDQPTLKNLSFISQNTTAGVSVNTDTYAIRKTETGYQLVVEVSSNSFYKQLQDSYIQAQISFLPVGEVSYAFINGVLLGKNTTTGERIFSFDIETDFDIDNHHDMIMTNFEMFANEYTLTKTPLSNTFRIHYTTNSVPITYSSTTADTHLGHFLLPTDTIAITEETIELTFGYALDNLWRRSRSVASGNIYEKYANDVPMVYADDVYDIDPDTNTIFSFDTNNNIVYTILHHAGDPVLDGSGDPVYAHRAGDVKLDVNGQPIARSDLFTERHIDLLLVDGAYYFATDDSYAGYRNEIATVINTWVTDNLVGVEDVLLDKSEIYFYPTSAIGLVAVMLDKDTEAQIEARQTFDVTLYVSETVYNDTRIRKQLETSTIQTLNTSLQKTIVSVSDIIVSLKEIYGNSVVSFKVTGLGGKSNYETIAIKNEHQSLSLNKTLRVQDDGTLIVGESVNISFVKFTS